MAGESRSTVMLWILAPYLWLCGIGDSDIQLIDFKQSLIPSLKSVKDWSLFSKINVYSRCRESDDLFGQIARLIVANFRHRELCQEKELGKLLLGTLKVLTEIYLYWNFPRFSGTSGIREKVPKTLYDLGIITQFSNRALHAALFVLHCRPAKPVFLSASLRNWFP